jgi:uncharacterized tellurite resistance protein B-like protein
MIESNITDILAKLDLPNGFSKLKPDQRKFLLAAILGSVVPIDGKIKAVEVEQLKNHLQHRYHLSAETLKLAVSSANTGLTTDQLHKAVQQLPELLSIDDRTVLIRMLWDLAICDDELHASEESLIYKIADSSGVPRRRVVEQQARAQSHHGS